ncbi:ABC transporter permease [Propioniciclava coleopterorum]|uniref:ABC transporter permease n=1 Tax=Propioniciclava coleopterorum TaxID=2714937 RepID=A0A6G7Y8W1_9ACTN|nr:ABC transporter permease [Propioniciclava coleopterorum]QIK73071.1 ABC transporter permease [Propioniciclava coleopterorum]
MAEGAKASAWRERGRTWAITAGSIVLALLVGAVLMVVSDPDVIGLYAYLFTAPALPLGATWAKVAGAYSALVVGAVGSPNALAATAWQAAPLICAGLGVGLGFRAGLFNIGAQGQAIWGAIAAAHVGFAFHLPPVIHLIVAIVFGLISGAIWGGIVGFLKAKTGAHEVIVTIMLNYVALLSLTWLLSTPAFLRPGRIDPIAPVIDGTAAFPIIYTQLNVGFLVALLAAAAVWWLLDRSTLGFQIRAVGSNPTAAGTAGMNVPNVTMITMALSGMLCGLAGIQYALGPGPDGVATPLSLGLVGTVGFDAITVALLGRSKPLGIVLAGLLFGGLHSGGLAMQNFADTPLTLSTVLQALIVLFVAAPALVGALLPKVKTPQTANLVGGEA